MKNTSITQFHLTAFVQNIFVRSVNKPNFSEKQRVTSIFKLSFFLFALFLFGEIANAQSIYDWYETAPDGNWKQGASGARWTGGLYDEPPTGTSAILRFNNNHYLTMTNNVPYTYVIHKIIFGSSNSSSRVIGGTNSVQFFEYSGTWPRIQNDASNVMHTINFPIIASSNSGYNMELVANTGSLVFGGTINNNGRTIQIYGNNSSLNATNRYVKLNGIVSGSGILNVSQHGVVMLNTTHTYTGETQIDKGELYIETSGDAIASGSAIYLGNGGQLSNITKLFLSKPDGGATFSHAININNGNASTRFLGGVNSSGTNTFSAGISIDASKPLNLEATTFGGTVDFTGIISGTSGTITTLGAGTIKLSAANSYTGTTTITAGTLQLGASGVIPDASNVVLNGGTLSTGASSGYSETAGTLTLGANSTISFGTGSHSLTFAASNGVTWSGNTLTVNNWSSAGPKLYFGSSSSGLTTDQLAKINFTGFGLKARILSTGEVIPASYISTLAGNWNSVNSWVGGIIPSSGADVFIQSGHNITLDANVTVASLTINSGGIFTASDGSAKILTITKSTSGSSITLSNSGTWANGAGTSTVVFTGAPNLVNAIHEISGSIAFQNITVNKTGGSSDVGCTFGATSSVSGTLEIGTGGYIASAPPTGFYSANAILKFNQGELATYEVYSDDYSWSITVIPNYITISSGTVNLNADRTATGNLLIDGGALVLNSNSPNLTIQGNWTRSSGTFTAGTGTVTLSGTTSGIVNVTGGGTMYNLTINKTSGASATLASNITVAGALTITEGTLSIASGKFLTVDGTVSNNAGISGLVIESGGSFKHNTSDVDGTVKRDVINANWETAKDGWHFLSSPVANQAISTAFTTDPYDFFCWDEPSNIWVNFKNQSGGSGIAPFFNVINGSNNFVSGKGYMAAYDGGGTKSYTGKINVASIPFSNLTISSGTNSGWHLLGNPFSCALTWDGSVDWNLSNIAGVAKVWNESIQDYSDITSDPVSVIPATNGFMVKVANATNSITVPTSKRDHSIHSYYKSTVPEIKLVATNIELQNGKESAVYFNPNATANFDLMYDGEFLSGYGPKFYSMSGDIKLSTNSLPELSSETTIPFYFYPNEGSSFTIEAQSISSIPGSVFLTDLKTNMDQDLTKNPVYAFTANSVDDPARFVISFSHLSVEGKNSPNSIAVYAYEKNIYVSGLTGIEDGHLFVYNLMGQKIADNTFSGNSHQITLNVPCGYYFVKVVTKKTVQTTKVYIK